MTVDAHPITQDELRFELNRTQDEFRAELGRTQAEFRAESSRTRDEFRAELSRTREEFQAGLSQSRDEFRSEMNLLRNEMVTHHATKADLHALEARLVKWMIGLMIGSVGTAVSIAVAADRLWT